MGFFGKLRSFLSREKQVYALVGRSGSGKSYRAHSLAYEHGIRLIIDDGLLIKGDSVLAGKSAKQEQNFLAAVKCALFTESDHLQSVMEALHAQKSRKVLIIGTSEKMVRKIAQRLNLPEPSRIIRIEDISSKKDIEKAMRTRYTEGKHVIPVAPMEVTRSYSNIAYGSLRTILRNLPFKLPFVKKTLVMEKTLVTPEFSKPDQTGITDVAMRQMVKQCLFEHENIFRVEDVSFTNSEKGYDILVKLRTPDMISQEKQLELQQFISEALEKYGNILVNSLVISLSIWAS